MFWRKKKIAVAATGVGSVTSDSMAPTDIKTEVSKKKTKKLSPQEIMINQIEQLGQGQSLVYRFPELLWQGLGAFAIVEVNSLYPESGRKYIIYTDKMADGKPAGRRSKNWASNKPKDIVRWILDRDGVLFSLI